MDFPRVHARLLRGERLVSESETRHDEEEIDG